MDDLSAFCQRALAYDATLKKQREAIAPQSFWYPYSTMSNFTFIDRLLQGTNRNLFDKINPKRAADIGGADGDIAFFFEREGWDMTLIDNGSTNWNGLKGARLFRDSTSSKIQIMEMDLDSQFKIEERFELVFFLGILYHLKNPFYALEQLSRRAQFAFLSTRIMRWSAPKEENSSNQPTRQLMEHLPVAYLLGPRECNNDSTNYWIFSEAGLRRIIDRTGWEIQDYLLVGEEENADPFTAANDARFFGLLESRHR